MVSCCMSGCTATHRNSPSNHTFYRIPTNPEIRKKWLYIINRPNWTPHKYSTVCGKHFEQTCFIQRKTCRVLRTGSIPTLHVPIKLPPRRLVTSYVHRHIFTPEEENRPSSSSAIPGNIVSPRKKKLINKNTRLEQKIKEKKMKTRDLSDKMETDTDDCRYFGLCKCCLEDGCFRSMWAGFNEDSTVKNFGEMLKECFGLNWQKPDNEHLDQICDDCIELTKITYQFRLKVLESQEQLNRAPVTVKVEIEKEEIGAEAGISVKDEIEDADYEPEYLEEYVDEVDSQIDPDKRSSPDQDYDSQDDDSQDNDSQDDDVEFLVIEDKEDFEAEENDDSEDYTPIQERSKTRDRGVYKNYTMEDFMKSVEAVKSGAMTPAVAAERYNVPRKTIAARLLAEKRGILPKPLKGVKTHYRTLIEEVQTLLTYTNITPFKTKTAHYHCAYCSTTGPVFEDADSLRTHTRTQHAGERTKAVENILRPLWLNEVLKVDIENLHCTVCCIMLTTWNDMFKHLKENHDLDFDEAYNRVIPFILKGELRCALCKELFPNFHHLDGHMNAHYNNYMCSNCGETFLSESRLKKHVKIHRTGKYPCGECGKVYTLDKYRKKHIDLVHKQNKNIRCLYCEEKFVGTYPRHLHVMQHHREKVSFITCELCGKTFDWRPYYLVHVKRKHENEKKYKCTFCDAFFFMKSELTRHLTTHTGEKYKCSLCNKVYSSKGSLTTHLAHIHDMHLDSKRSNF